MPFVARRQILTGAAAVIAVAGMAAAGAEAGLAVRPPGNARVTRAGKGRVAPRGAGIWTTQVGSSVDLLTAAGSVVCVFCQDGVVALDAGDGTRRWTLAYEPAGAVVTAGDLIFVPVQGHGESATKISVLRASDGAVVERFPGMDTAQAGDGVIYLWSSQINGPAPGVFAVRPDGKGALTRTWNSPDAVVQQVTGDVVFTSRGYAFRGSDGAQICTFPPGETVQHVAGGIAYLSNGNITIPSAPISALDLSNGTLLWTFTAASTVLAVSGGIAFVSDSEADNPTVYALGAGDGRRLWTFRTASLGSPSLAVDRDVVYIGTGTSLAGIAKGSGGSVHALRVSDGAELWRFSAIGDAPASLVTASGSVYICDGSLIGMGTGGGGRVTALRSRDGTGIWSFQPGGSNPQLVIADSAMYMTVGGPFPADGGTSHETAVDSGVWALRPQSGARVWELTVPWPGQDSAPPLALRRGMAYVGAGDGTVHALRS